MYRESVVLDDNKGGASFKDESGKVWSAFLINTTFPVESFCNRFGFQRTLEVNAHTSCPCGTPMLLIKKFNSSSVNQENSVGKAYLDVTQTFCVDYDNIANVYSDAFDLGVITAVGLTAAVSLMAI